MNTKRVDRLERGDRIKFEGAVRTVTRTRPGARPNSRDLRLRDIAEPHDVIERELPDHCPIEVVSDDD